MAVRGNLIPDLRGRRSRDVSMNQFLAGLIAEDSDGDESSERDPYNENDPSCCSTRSYNSEKDFPFANYHQVNTGNPFFRAEPPQLTVDQFVQGMIDDVSSEGEEDEQFHKELEAASSSCGLKFAKDEEPEKKEKKPRKAKKEESKEEPETSASSIKEEEPVEKEEEEASVKEEPKAIPKGKGRKRSTTRKRKSTIEAEVSSKKARPTPPSSPSVGTDVDE